MRSGAGSSPLTRAAPLPLDLIARVLLDPGDAAVVEEPHSPAAPFLSRRWAPDFCGCLLRPVHHHDPLGVAHDAARPAEVFAERGAQRAVAGGRAVAERVVLAAKWAADRFSARLYQEALAELITSGQFERYLRRAGARKAGRRRALITALRERFGSRVEIAGENTGVHLVVWLNDVRPRELNALIARAARAGVGTYSVAPYYADPRRAGLLFGYAALTEGEIRAGVRRLAELLSPARP